MKKREATVASNSRFHKKTNKKGVFRKEFRKLLVRMREKQIVVLWEQKLKQEKRDLIFQQMV